MVSNVSLFLAFVAGLLSFLSPCVLPLIPSYLSILSGIGITTDKASPTASRARLVTAALGFVLGFTVIFVLLAIVISTTFYLIGDITRYIAWIGGGVVIIMGLNIIFDFLSFLNFEKRPFFKPEILQKARHSKEPKGKPASALRRNLRGAGGACIAGAAFATGWTPCIGPILAGILFMAGQSSQMLTAVTYLTIYSAGLAVPFILVALFFNAFLQHVSGFRKHMALIKRTSGIILIAIGITILTGNYAAFPALTQNLIFRYIAWAETQVLPFRLIAQWLSWIHSF
ncbi:MAG: cytochrome c biogenesis protein CcdA [Treponema sp.]|nr:cytochrome c biogenesis protein CcdA [Treponema sp.]